MQDQVFNVPLEEAAVIIKNSIDGTVIGTDSTDASGNYSIDYFMVGVNDNNLLPTEYYLGNPYPQPFNPSAKIDFTNPKQGAFDVRVYNIIGQLLYNSNFNIEAGSHSFRISGLGSAGVYLFNISGKDYSSTRKLILIDGGGSSSINVELTAGRNNSLRRTKMGDLLIEFRKPGYVDKDTILTWDMNLVVDVKLEKMLITRQADVHGLVKDSITQSGISSAQVSVYKVSDSSLLTTSLTDSSGNYTATFNFLGYADDPDGIYNNIGDIRIEASKNGYTAKDTVKSFAVSSSVDFSLIPITYNLNATINLYNTKGDVISDLDSLKFIWPDSTIEMIPVVNGTVTLNRVLYLLNSDTTAEVTHNHPELYLNWIIGTTNNQDKVEWLYQNQTPFALNNSKIPLIKINNKTTEAYLIPKYVNYGANNDLQIDMSGSVVTSMLARGPFGMVSGFRPSDYDTTEIVQFLYNETTGDPIDQSNIDRAYNEIEKFFNAVNSWTHKKLFNYRFTQIDSSTDPFWLYLTNPNGRNQDNVSHTAFWQSGPSNAVSISLDGSFRIKKSDSKYNVSNSYGQIQDEFFCSMTNTQIDNTDYLMATNISGIPYTDLAKNLIGISLIMKPGTYYWEQ